MTQISSEPTASPRKNAILEPSGEIAASLAFSISCCGLPPNIEIFQRLGPSCAAPAEVNNKCVPSGNQPMGKALKPLGNCSGRTSLVSICRMYTPVVSEYATYLPSRD